MSSPLEHLADREADRVLQSQQAVEIEALRVLPVAVLIAVAALKADIEECPGFGGPCPDAGLYVADTDTSGWRLFIYGLGFAVRHGRCSFWRPA